MSLRQVEQLRRSELSAATISKAVDNGYSPGALNALRRQGLSTDTLSKVVNKGYSTRHIDRLQRSGIPDDDIAHFVNKGVDLRWVGFFHNRLGRSSTAIKQGLRLGE